MQFIFDLVFLIDYVDYFLTYGNIKIIYRLTFTFTLQSRNSKHLCFVIYGICFWLKDNAGVLRGTHGEQKSPVEQKGKSPLDFDFQ